MKAKKIVSGALKVAGKWLLENQNVALDTVNKFAKKYIDTKAEIYDESTATTEEKVDLLGAATLELDRKIDLRADRIQKELSEVHKQVRILKFSLSVMAVVLGVAVIGLIILAVKG